MLVLFVQYASALSDGCLRRDCISLERVQLAIARSVLRCPAKIAPQLGGAETNRLAHSGVSSSSQQASVLLGSAEQARST